MSFFTSTVALAFLKFLPQILTPDTPFFKEGRCVEATQKNESFLQGDAEPNTELCVIAAKLSRQAIKQLISLLSLPL